VQCTVGAVYNCVSRKLKAYTIVHYKYCTLQVLKDQPEDGLVSRPKYVAEYNLI